MHLSADTLAKLDPGVATPDYDRSTLNAGILHIGTGNFHRAHQATYLDDLFNLGRDHDWAIHGAGVMPGDAGVRRALDSQDWLTTVVERDADSISAKVIGSMVGFAEIAEDHAPLRAALVEPAIRIVSMTVTEGGYFIDPSTGTFDPDHPQIRADGETPDSPSTVFGVIIEALKARRDNGLAPFTVMSCDNLPHNGTVTRSAVVGLAGQSDPAFAGWIDGNIAFPNGMVDRITPATSDRERRFVKDRFGYEDAWPVFCEPFRQWVLEDSFSQGRPALEEVGVQFVADVTPYETMKIRILNGGHATIAYAGGLLGIEFVHEAMEHPLIGTFLDVLERREILPGIPPVPDTSLTDYLDVIHRRFANPTIGDTVRRLCFDGSNRQPKFIIPSVADALRQGRPADGLALVSALWCRYCQGKTDAGEVIAPNDPNWDRLTTTAAEAADDPAVWLGMREIYGDIATHPEFASSFAGTLRTISTEGAETAIRRYLQAAGRSD